MIALLAGPPGSWDLDTAQAFHVTPGIVRRDADTDVMGCVSLDSPPGLTIAADLPPPRDLHITQLGTTPGTQSDSPGASPPGYPPPWPFHLDAAAILAAVRLSHRGTAERVPDPFRRPVLCASCRIAYADTTAGFCVFCVPDPDDQVLDAEYNVAPPRVVWRAGVAS